MRALKINKEYVTEFIIFLYVLFLLQFMGMVTISYSILFATLLPFILIEIRKPVAFRNILIALMIGIGFSMISSLHFRQQSLLETLQFSLPIFLICFYFFLLNRNFSLNTVERVVVFFGIFAATLYIFQFVLLQYGVSLIRTAEKALTASSTEGERFRMMGSGILSLSFFLCLNKIMTEKNKIIYIICVSLCFIAIVLMGFRTMIAGLILFTLFLIFKVNWKRKWLILILLPLFTFIMMQIPAVNNRITYMVEKQQGGEQSFGNSDYVRWVELDYFMNHHFKSNVEMFFGSGMTGSKSRYGMEIAALQDTGIYWQDWGLLGLSWMIGVIPVFCMLLYSFTAYRMKVGDEYKYIGIWFAYLVLISITSREFYRQGNFLIQAFALYIVFAANKKYQDQKNMNYENRNINIS